MFHLNIKKIKEYGHNAFNCQGEITGIDIDSLNGGFSQAQVFRITLTFENCPHHLALVQKVTDPGEVQVMLALSELLDFETMPEVIDHAWSPNSEEKSDNWFITPFYAGTALTFQDEVPTGVVRSLVQLHHYFQGKTERFKSLYRIDASFLKNTLASAVKALESAVLDAQNPIFEHGLEHLRKTEKNGKIFQALESLPVTLTHGDMHPANLIRPPEGRTVLIDWGNARIAPAMLDIDNLIELDSENWHIYLQAWQEVSGRPIDLRLAQLGYYWGTIMVNTQYLPHAVKFAAPEHVGKMVKKTVDAEQHINDLLK